MTPAIVVDSVWKKFRKGESHDSLKDWIPAMVRRGLRRERTDLDKEEFWALRDVSFDVKPGEAMAIIGPNGAGKSTSLKILSRILRPNKGRCVVRGRVGALIEVAAGFHPDLTGRENVLLQGAIMGMRRNEIRRHFDEIVEFASVSDFIDTPVKRYSSGMHARLGFSIAAHLDPDVLIIDEVLSVGDMAFQQKCVQRAKEHKKRGIAIVFVSHNLQAVMDLCDRAVYLHREVRAEGPTQEVLAEYLLGIAEPAESSGPVTVIESSLVDADGRPVSAVPPGKALSLRITFDVQETIVAPAFGFVAYRSTDNLRTYSASYEGVELGVDTLQPGERHSLTFDFMTNLTRGQYHFEFHILHSATHRYIAKVNPAALLTINETRTNSGVADLALRARAAMDAAPAVQHPSAVAHGRNLLVNPGEVLERHAGAR